MLVVCTLALAGIGVMPFARATLVTQPDGTAIDSDTSLQWDRCAWGQTGGACAGTAAALTWQQALAAAQKANASVHKGHTSWRVPNRTELESLVQLGSAGSLAIGTAMFPAAPPTPFWSSTSSHAAPAQAWVVDSSDGGSTTRGKADIYSLRLVRGGGAARAFQSRGPTTTPNLVLPSLPPSSTAQATVSGGGGCYFSNARFVPLTSFAVPPPVGATFPADLFDFMLDGCSVGGTATITITYAQPLPVNAQYWKYGPVPGGAVRWYPFGGATISGPTATLTITDGALGDDDLQANGSIVDAGGPALLPTAAVIAAIPTLSQSGQLLLSLLMAAGMAAYRRTKK